MARERYSRGAPISCGPSMTQRPAVRSRPVPPTDKRILFRPRSVTEPAPTGSRTQLPAALPHPCASHRRRTGARQSRPARAASLPVWFLMGRFGGLDPPSWLSPIMRGTLCEMKRHPFSLFLRRCSRAVRSRRDAVEPKRGESTHRWESTLCALAGSEYECDRVGGNPDCAAGHR
jgi:hypothetical protein